MFMGLKSNIKTQLYASQQCKNQLGKVNKIILELMCNELRKML